MKFKDKNQMFIDSFDSPRPEYNRITTINPSYLRTTFFQKSIVKKSEPVRQQFNCIRKALGLEPVAWPKTNNLFTS